MFFSADCVTDVLFKPDNSTEILFLDGLWWIVKSTRSHALDFYVAVNPDVSRSEGSYHQDVQNQKES